MRKQRSWVAFRFVFLSLSLLHCASLAMAGRPLSDFTLPVLPWYLNQGILYPMLVVALVIAIVLRTHYWRKSQQQARSDDTEESEQIEQMNAQEPMAEEVSDEESNDLTKEGDSSGFTLVELIVVVAIVSLLSAIGVSNYMMATIRAKVAACHSNMRVIEGAIMQYRNDFGKYPAFYRADNSEGFNAWLVIVPMTRRLSVLTTPISYIRTVPRDPFPVQECSDNTSILFFDTFDYADADSLATFGNDISGKTSGSSWRLSSPGPDQIQAFGGFTAEAGRESVSNLLGVDYDPTNGIISFGDIVRVGERDPRGTLPAIQRVPNYEEHFRRFSASDD